MLLPSICTLAHFAIFLSATTVIWKMVKHPTPGWAKEVISQANGGHAQFQLKLHWLAAAVSCAGVLWMYMITHPVLPELEPVLAGRQDVLWKLGSLCAVTVGGLAFKSPNPESSIRSTRTRPVRVLCGASFGFGLGILLIWLRLQICIP